MTKKYIPIIALFLGVFINLKAHAADDKIMNYVNGSAIGTTTSLSIADQQFAGFFVSPVTSAIKQSYVTATLRYEESLLPLFGVTPNNITGEFRLQITYDIELTDASYNVTTKTNQSLEITYDIDAGTTYKDIDVIRYAGYLEGKISNIVIEFDELNDPTNDYSTSYIPEDVYFELSCEVERYYELVIPSPWSVYPDGSTASLNSKNELEISWDYVLGAESFDVEWVFVDITGNAATIQSANMSFDWRDATRINTTNNFYNISMSYPSGMLIYRVRPVGVDLTYGAYSINVFGDWSDPGTTTTTNYAYGTQKNGFVHLGLGIDKNWTYNVAYAEEGKRKEGISFFDGSARSRQEITILNSDQNAIVGETMYDFEGRPAVSILPTPVNSAGIEFYENTSNTPFNDYNKTSFDKDTDFISGPTGIITGISKDYYSSTTTSTSLFKDFIPDAEEFPYSRTIYKRDGTDRISEQTGVGIELIHGSGNTTKYYYGTPADMEIERLFGNEVGEAAFYQKNMVKDPNGQVSIQYLDKEGRTIATSLAGNMTTPLLNLDYKPEAVDITANLLSNNIYTSNESKSMHVLTISTPNTDVNFTYTLDSIHFASCDTTYICKYTLDIKVLDEDGVEQLGTGISYSGYYDSQYPSTLPTIPFTVSGLDIGTYRVTKTLKIDETYRQHYVTRFEDRIRENLLSQTCVPYDPPAAVGCPTCEDICDSAFVEFLYYDSGAGTNVYAYYDENGDLMDPAPSSVDYAAMVAACKAECTEPLGSFDFSPCELRLELMKLQMSPGGQYFDNLKEKYQDANNDGIYDLDANGEPLIMTSPAYDIDDWLETNFGVNPSSGTFTNSGITTLLSGYSTWEDVRNNWHLFPTLAGLLVEDHPEYCAYSFNCLQDIPLDDGSGISCDVNRSDLLTFDYYMMAGSSIADSEKEKDITSHTNLDYMDYLNPMGFTLSTYTTTPAGMTADNTLYMDAISAANAADDPGGSLAADFLIDPLFSSTCTTLVFKDINNNNQVAKTWVENHLRNFLGFDGNPSASPPVAPTTYHSIWYVMEDPENITSQSSLPSGMSQEAFDFYNQLHGNSNVSPAVVGIFDKNGTDPNKINKYQFFRGVYKFYRDFILYQFFKEQTDPCSGVTGKYTYWDDDVVDGSSNLVLTSYNATRDQVVDDKFTLVWPRNLVFDIFDDNYSNMSSTIVGSPSLSESACESNCEDNALAWINEYSSCIDAWVAAGSLSAVDETQLRGELKADLIEICQLNCYVSPIPSSGLIGSSDGDGTTLFNALTTGPTLSDYMTTGLPTASSNVATFDELIAYYDTYFGTTCTESVVFPNTATPAMLPATVADCNCNQLAAYADSTSISPTNYSVLASAINTQFSTSFSAGDIERWSDYCSGDIGDIIDFPAALECIDCKCENLAFFIAERLGFDPYTLTGQDLTDTKDFINSEFGTSYTNTEITNMMDQCQAGTSSTPLNYVTNVAFEDLPELFKCNANLENIDPAVDCATELNRDNLNNYLNFWEQQLKSAITNFYNAYTAKCMENIKTRETFTAEYELNEFMYTLYYYDQAGNLIKTVPPEGVIPKLTTASAFFTDVDNHRLDPGLNAHQNVEHTLVTQYKYDSYNNLIWQSTPDGGVTNFWYDKLGRLVLSQNAKQATLSNYVYSYTLYDSLGRIYEVGEVETTTEIDDDIVAYYYEEFYQWIIGGTGTISTINYPTTTRTEVTSTYYDETLNTTVNGYFTGGSQKELRTRVSSITREETFDNDDDTYNYGTHFSYDIHGNVKEIIQENNYLNVTAAVEKTKQITYEYDLISGNVNKVNYQPGRADQFYHRYCYDADNRITIAETSRDNYIWDTDAKYFYYEHGPLARVEIGEKQVAGSDYAYTLQGWIKGINSNTLNASFDIGNDAEIAGGLNEHFATDAYGYSLGYFEDDYSASNTSFLATTAGSNFNTASPSLYNGNIRHMVTALLKEDETPTNIHGTAYRYDQANRIRSSNVFTGVSSNSFAAASDDGRYQTEYHYDLNGNITNLKRSKISTSPTPTGPGLNVFDMDELEYYYNNQGNNQGNNPPTGHSYGNNTSLAVNTNQLMHVEDKASVTVMTTDIETTGTLNANNPTTNNYKYDDIGQLIKDDSEDISEIVWDVYNKIKEIKYTDYTHDDIEFKYDPSGNRIAKILKTKDAAGGTLLTADQWEYYFYNRDASGNIMAVYNQEIEHISGNNYKSYNILIEKDIYGSSRLGTDILRDTIITDFSATFSTTGATIQSGTAYYSTNRLVEVNSSDVITVEDLTTADINITIQANDADIIFDFSAIPDYTVTSGSLNVSGGGELYLSANQRVSIEMDGYQFAMTTSGKGAYIYPNNGNSLRYSSPAPLSHSDIKLYGFDNYARVTGEKVYEKSNHLGNVLVTLSDRKLPKMSSEKQFYWDFESSSADEVNNSGIDPTTNTATFVSSAGYDGSDVIETNTGDYVEYADDARLDFGNNDFTVAVWAKKISQLSYGNGVVGKWNSGAVPGTNEWLINLNTGVAGATKGPTFYIEIGSALYGAQVASPVTNTGQWYFLVGKREKDTISIYVDGVLQDTTILSFAHSGAAINNISGRELKIGGVDNGVYSNMQVDNLMIFNEALSDDQIASMYSGSLYSYYEPDVKSYSDYYPFGSLMPNRFQSSGDYRYGFGGHEKDDEINNVEGSSYDMGARMYDPRLGRMRSIDPDFRLYPGINPYNYALNIPTRLVDGDGENATISIDYSRNTITMSSTIYLVGVNADDEAAKNLQSTWDAGKNSYQVKDPNDPSKVWTVKVDLVFVNDITVKTKANAMGVDNWVGGQMNAGEPGLNSNLGIGEGDNILILDNDGSSRTHGQSGQGLNVGVSESSGSTGVHETLHMLGMDERYFNGNSFSVEVAGLEKDFLSNGDGSEMMPFHFADILDFSLESTKGVSGTYNYGTTVTTKESVSTDKTGTEVVSKIYERSIFKIDDTKGGKAPSTGVKENTQRIEK